MISCEIGATEMIILSGRHYRHDGSVAKGNFIAEYSNDADGGLK